MADIKGIKKALGFDFRATFYSQNAENLLDGEVVKDVTLSISKSQLNNGILVKKGKKNFLLIKSK